MIYNLGLLFLKKTVSRCQRIVEQTTTQMNSRKNVDFWSPRDRLRRQTDNTWKILIFEESKRSTGNRWFHEKKCGFSAPKRSTSTANRWFHEKNGKTWIFEESKRSTGRVANYFTKKKCGFLEPKRIDFATNRWFHAREKRGFLRCPRDDQLTDDFTKKLWTYEESKISNVNWWFHGNKVIFEEPKCSIASRRFHEKNVHFWGAPEIDENALIDFT